MENGNKDFVILATLRELKAGRKQIRYLKNDIIINYSLIGTGKSRTAKLVLEKFRELYYSITEHHFTHPAKQLGLYIVKKQQQGRVKDYFTNIDTNIFK